MICECANQARGPRSVIPGHSPAQRSAGSASNRGGARLRKTFVNATSVMQLVLLREADLPAVAEHGGLRAQIHFTDVR